MNTFLNLQAKRLINVLSSYPFIDTNVFVSNDDNNAAPIERDGVISLEGNPVDGIFKFCSTIITPGKFGVRKVDAVFGTENGNPVIAYTYRRSI